MNLRLEDYTLEWILESIEFNKFWYLKQRIYRWRKFPSINPSLICIKAQLNVVQGDQCQYFSSFVSVLNHHVTPLWNLNVQKFHFSKMVAARPFIYTFSSRTAMETCMRGQYWVYVTKVFYKGVFVNKL